MSIIHDFIKENKDILVALISVILTSVIACRNTKKNINSALKNTNKQIKSSQDISQKQISVQHITDKRIEWMQELRILIGEFISLSIKYTEFFMNNYEKVEEDCLYNELLLMRFEINLRIAKLKLLLNYRGELDKKIIGYIDDIANKLPQRGDESAIFKHEYFIENILNLTNYAQVYLKLEWERCKMEILIDANLDTEKRNEYLKKKMNELYNNLIKEIDE